MVMTGWPDKGKGETREPFSVNCDEQAGDRLKDHYVWG